MRVKHKGGMSFVAQTRGHEIVSDLPEAMAGQDTGMTPPEWLLAALGSCVGVYMANYCKAKELPYEGMEVEIAWEKGADPVRISSIRCDIHMPQNFPENMRDGALKVAKQCMVHNTLHLTPDIAIDYASN
jgi:putative redox protein